MPAADSPAREQLSEGQIAMVAELANTSEIEQGKLAQGKAKSPSVKKFAAMMVQHHTEAKTEQAKLFKQLNLTPTQSQTATSLKQSSETATSELRSTATAFDQRYVDSQIEAHEQVLETLDNQLIPAATDPSLKAGLNKMRATVEAHLREAKSIQAELAAKQAAQ
jgi:putative membrane protein